MRYFKPTSLTWWSGITALALGILMLVCRSCELGDFGALIAALAGSGDASPAGLIVLGLGLIGLRDKLGRMT